MIVFAATISSILVAISVHPLVEHTQMPVLTAALIILVGSALLGAGMVYPGQRRWKTGAVKLFVDSAGFSLEYSSTLSTRVDWNDLDLHFDLIDLSHVNSQLLLVDTPYSVAVEGVRSLLTPEAFARVVSEVNNHRLNLKRELGSRFLYESNSQPVIIHVSHGHP